MDDSPVRLTENDLHYISAPQAVTRVVGQEALLDHLARALGINHQVQAEMEEWVFRDWRKQNTNTVPT